mgnify:CR=1 FL=1
MRAAIIPEIIVFHYENPNNCIGLPKIANMTELLNRSIGGLNIPKSKAHRCSLQTSYGKSFSSEADFIKYLEATEEKPARFRLSIDEDRHNINRHLTPPSSSCSDSEKRAYRPAGLQGILS